jgi:ABC-2 type transport system permease protein
VEALSMSAIYILWLRELRRYTRSRVQLIASLGQPVLYLVAMGFGMGAVFRQAGRGSYLQFVAPGVIAMTILFSATFSGIALLWDRQFGFLKETLVAPVPRVFIMLGRTSGAATVALLQGLLVAVVCLIFGFRPASLWLVPQGIAFMALIALVFAGVGTTVGSSLKDMQGFQMVMNFLVMPLFFLSGALYPLDGLPRVLAAVTRVDPLSYGVDGMRSALIAQTHFGVAVDFAVLVGLAVVFIILGAWRFSKIEV